MWDNIIVNDPDDDYNLVIELWHNEKNCGIIKWNQSDEKYNLIIYPNKGDFVIPCDILEKILARLDSLQNSRTI